MEVRGPAERLVLVIVVVETTDILWGRSLLPVMATTNWSDAR